MHHAIIIPVYERPVAECLASLHASAAACGTDDYEIIVSDGGSKIAHRPQARERVVRSEGLEPVRPLPGESLPLNKPRLLNAGLDAVKERECIITFLDADALVGRRFMEATRAAEDHDRACYRVRTAHKATDIESPEAWREAPIQYEAYDDPDDDWAARLRCRPPVEPAAGCRPIGNSQFSILKSKLGEMRWNEQFFGRGFEDLWMLRELWRRGLHNTTIALDREHAMWHRFVLGSPHFRADRWAERNYRLYHGRQSVWVIAASRGLLEKFSNALVVIPGSSKAGCRFLHRDEFAENIRQEVLPGLDKVIFLDRSRISGNAGCATMVVDGFEVLNQEWEHVLSWIGLAPTTKQMAESRQVLETR